MKNIRFQKRMVVANQFELNQVFLETTIFKLKKRMFLLLPLKLAERFEMFEKIEYKMFQTIRM